MQRSSPQVLQVIFTSVQLINAIQVRILVIYLGLSFHLFILNSDTDHNSSLPAIVPETQASDDLELSNLIVGKEYAYCVRAINNKHYMDSPCKFYDTYWNV